MLRPGSVLVYTVPTVLDRLTRRRGADEPVTFHGNPETADHPVVSEYGADMWAQAMDAGFRRVDIHAFDYPAGIAHACSV